MITGLLIVIVLFECVRLWCYIQDSRRVRRLNDRAETQQKKALEFGGKQDAEWKRIAEAVVAPNPTVQLLVKTIGVGTPFRLSGKEYRLDREVEIEELRELAKSSDTMKSIIDELLEDKNKEVPNESQGKG